MNFLIKSNRTNPWFERPVESVLEDGFFQSFDTNIREYEDRYLLVVATPGMNKNHLSLQISGNVLIVKGERQEAHSEASFVYREFKNATFQRSFMLPDNSNPEAISAECADGILTISIDKKKSGLTVKEIAIKDGSNVKKSFWKRFLRLFSVSK